MKASRSTRPLWEVRESSILGFGVFALCRIPRRTRIIEYTGVRISHEESSERYDDDRMERHHTFLFTVDEDTVIDAAQEGNEARFINHACDPNCEAVDEDGRIFIETIRDIAPGEELTYDYNLEREGPYQASWNQTYVCQCGGPSCRGTLLAPRLEHAPETSPLNAGKEGSAA
jgi:SET domain-containing protein